MCYNICFFIFIFLTVLNLNCQEYRQIIATSSGCYGIVNIEKEKQVDDKLRLKLTAQWVNKDLEPIVDNESVVILKKENLLINPANCIANTIFEDTGYIFFNKSYELCFVLNENIKEEEISFNLTFDIAQDPKDIDKSSGTKGVVFKKPRTINIPYSIDIVSLVKLKNTPPEIKIISPVTEPGQKIITKEFEIDIIGKAIDESGINLVMVNSKDAEMFSDGTFKSKVILNSGDNVIKIMAIDNDGSITEEQILLECQNYSMVAQLVDVGKYYALLIAVENYNNHNINDLEFAIDDAKAVYDILTTYYTFDTVNVSLLINPTRENIVVALDRLAEIVTEKDNLLIFYAGHGYWSEKIEAGYWLPSDANKSNTVNWFGNSTLRDFINGIKSKHTLLIADACFSGGIFKTRKAFANAPVAIEKLYFLTSRKAMTSGTLSEVPDKSVFVEYLIKRLKENNKTFLSSEELFSSLRTAVMNNSPNIPQFGEILNTGDEGGDFIFIRKIKY